MDVAYDHSFDQPVATQKDDKGKSKQTDEPAQESLSDEFQQAYRAVANSPWGARLGGFLGTVKKQGEAALETGKKEYTSVASQATKGLEGLRHTIVERTRGLSLSGGAPPVLPNAAEKKDGEEEGFLARLTKTAKIRIAEIEAAEKRADEYLANFGSTVGSFLKDAVTIAPPENEELVVGRDGEVLFENKTKGQIYTTRLDQQLHLLHNKLELFKADPESEDSAWAEFKATFSVEKETESIAGNLERYPELRSAMEELVPAEVKYEDFWTRYYFLRRQLDMEEMRRKELLKGAVAQNEEEVGWDEDDESDDEPEKKDVKQEELAKKGNASAETLLPGKREEKSPKKEEETQSKADSEESYDLVSGQTSKVGTPPRKGGRKEDVSDSEEDWE